MKPFKFIFALTIAVLFGFHLSANAHSVLKDSNPKEGEVVTESLKEMTISFNTKVENGSQFYLVNSDGKKQVPDQIEVNEQNMIGTFKDPLENSTYTLHWKIIGADGHPVEGNFTFQVSADEQEQVNDNDNTIETPQANESVDENTNNQTKEESKNNLSPIMIGVIVLLAVIAIGMFIRVIRMGK
jgi:copper resistance protein C